jgi:hypothetical protein
MTRLFGYWKMYEPTVRCHELSIFAVAQRMMSKSAVLIHVVDSSSVVIKAQLISRTSYRHHETDSLILGYSRDC